MIPVPDLLAQRAHELEAAIVAHPAIAEAAVHAVPPTVTVTEDEIKVCVVPADGAVLDPKELFEFFKASLPFYAIPRYVEVVDSLPKNAVSRVMKHQLRDRGVTDATWDFEALNLVVARDERR